MIVYVSPAEMNGGILQFSISMARETKKLRDCKLFLPDTVESKIYEDISENIVTYNKVKTLKNNDKRICGIVKKIMSFSPEAVIFLEDSILMQQINRILNKAGISTAMVIHDIRHHPYRNMGTRRIAVDIVRRIMTRKTIKECTRIILLSKNSKLAFKDKYKSDNTVIFRLPAHMPNAQSEIPAELKNNSENFFLFFGRIDKYKGINILCSAYSSLQKNVKCRNKLVIAGKGNLSDEELRLINEDPDILLINRFIEDGEMVWLFQNSAAVIMPYVEASQSGVLPIAYKFTKPVIVSDLRGLTENVLQNKTGYIFNTTDELKEILCHFDTNDFSQQDIAEFYQRNFSWENGLENLFDIFQTKESDD